MHDDNGTYWCLLCRKVAYGHYSAGYEGYFSPREWHTSEVCSSECAEVLGIRVSRVPTWRGPSMLEKSSIRIVGERRTDPCLVYFIQCGDEGPIKIGKSTNVESRLQSLQGASPYKLNLLAWFLGVSADETRLHELFAKHRMRGEWFEPSEDIYRYIMDIMPWPEIA